MIAITVEGVIKQFGGDGIIPAGIQLYASLTAFTRVILLSTERDDKIKHWLGVNGLKDHVNLFADLQPQDQITILNKARAAGDSITAFINADPTRVKEALFEGIPALLYVHPQYSVPAFRPDYVFEPRPWDELVQEINGQNMLRDSDNRMEVEE